MTGHWNLWQIDPTGHTVTRTSIADIMAAMKEMFRDVIQRVMEVEMDEELGRERCQRAQGKSPNHRNDYSQKTVKTQLGEIDIKIPRDRKGNYEPKIISKYDRNAEGMEDKILSLYACGMSQRDIAEQIKSLYDLELEVLMEREASPVSNIHSKEYAYVTRCIRDHFPDIGVAPYVIMGGTDCRHFHALTETALRFAPVRMTNAQNATCHGVDENVTVEALAEGVRFFKRFLKEYEL